jgi:glyoxylase-like metal-dependent hydrolase (beta-lactamase superfamily II)
MRTPVSKALHDVGDGLFAYTQLPGSWGWSNAGLITDDDQSLLVDTLFDLNLTGEMLEMMRRATGAADRIGTVVNTHGNGDHCYGNALVADAEVVGTKGCVEDLLQAPPSRNQMLMRAARAVRALGAGGRLLARVLGAVGVERVALLADAGPLALPLFEDFDFKNASVVPPTRVFEGKLSLTVGDRRVDLIEVGPAHTLGDAVVWVPDARVLFTGDILFKDAHPVIWQGPVANWIAALRRLIDLEAAVVVPGHGPITDPSGLHEMLTYLELLSRETRARFDAGLSVEEAALDIRFEEFDRWIDGERLYVNVHTLYREFTCDREPADILALFAGMARVHAQRCG